MNLSVKILQLANHALFPFPTHYALRTSPSAPCYLHPAPFSDTLYLQIKDQPAAAFGRPNTA